MCQIVVVQVAARQDGVNERQAHGGTVAHCHGHGPVQFDNGRVSRLRQNVVQTHDLCPVGGFGRGRVSMYRRDGRLQRIRTEVP